jgi:hypothetical protein
LGVPWSDAPLGHPNTWLLPEDMCATLTKDNELKRALYDLFPFSVSCEFVNNLGKRPTVVQKDAQRDMSRKVDGASQQCM